MCTTPNTPTTKKNMLTDARQNDGGDISTISSPIAVDSVDQAKKIKYMFDCDGFSVGGEFLVKEIAIGNLDAMTVDLFHYRLPNSYHQLPPKIKYQVRWLTKNLHGLRYENDLFDLPLSAINETISKLCADCELNGRLIGYKGGHIEVDILKLLNYGHLAVNIEKYGCPRFDVLYKTINVTENMPLYHYKIACSKHVAVKTISNYKKMAHCSRVELVYFMAFLNSFIKQQQIT